MIHISSFIKEKNNCTHIKPLMFLGRIPVLHFSIYLSVESYPIEFDNIGFGCQLCKAGAKIYIFHIRADRDGNESS